MTHKNITSGVKAIGLYPLNPQAIPETAFAPSILTEAPAPPVSHDVGKENSQPRVSTRPITPEPSTSTVREKGIEQTPNRPSGRFDPVAYGNSSSLDDDEHHVPLAQVKRTAFQQLMPTPTKNTEKTLTVRGKAINFRGTPVTKDLFGKNREEKITKKSSAPKGRNSTKQKQAGWYCHDWELDEVTDMRQCCKCGKWYHEECVGLSTDDTDVFECPHGC
ncbi:hypothetical protein MML48_9g00019683 [Holotrichia oblita]|uniref:Uncharacterized protein n=1 Tax=Holotrichia oblita TaxID=644536 RepID=A0ACB9SIU7_HOLOL|nr:hypothetical protein MML48_9g00019683 [Holotrichia oblita]